MHGNTQVRTPRPLTDLQLSMKAVHGALETAGKRLGRHDREMVVDFTATLLRKLDQGGWPS